MSPRGAVSDLVLGQWLILGGIGLDALLDSPPEEVLQQRPLAVLLNDALLRHQGVMGTGLRRVLAYERADWENVTCQGVGSGTITAPYLESIAWAT